MKEHPIYGEILTAKEVSEITGFTMNQLRNWRIPARRNLAPFGFMSIGASPYYRKVVVEGWLEIHGGQKAEYFPTEFDKNYPVAE